MQNKSQVSNSNSHDNTFNFGNELDISNAKKNKNSQIGFKDGFVDFQDFQNIGDDKTVKSSFYRTKKEIFSNIIKKDIDQNSNLQLGNSILSNQNDFNTRTYISNSLRKISYENQKIPQFGDLKNNTQFKNNNDNRYVSKENFKSPLKQLQLQYTKINSGNFQNSIIKQEIRNPQLGVDSRIREKKQQQFKKKDYIQSRPQIGVIDSAQTREKQYKQILSMMNFYKNQAQKINYQRSILQQQSIKQLMSLTNNQFLEQQIRNHIQNINFLNADIEKQRAIQKKLSRVITELEDQYEQIILSVNQMDFRRPVIIKDQAKVLIQQINQLKNQFQDLKRQNGSLNLSCTLDPNYIGNRYQFQKEDSPQKIKIQSLSNSKVQEFNNLIQQIHLQNTRSQDTQFLKNLKLACIKSEWPIFTNKEIQVILDYKTFPQIQMKIGNKSNHFLKKFTIQKQFNKKCQKIMTNELLNKKSFITEIIQTKYQEIAQLFIKIRISYSNSSQQGSQNSYHQIRLFCPVGILNFGQFIPITTKQFNLELKKDQPFISSSLRTIDKNIVNSLQEIQLYFPNLKIYQVQQKFLFGRFLSVIDKQNFIIIEESLDLIRIKVKKNNINLLKLLQFILCL